MSRYQSAEYDVRTYPGRKEVDEPERPGLSDEHTGNFDFHRRKMQRSIRLFNKHLFWWTAKSGFFCYNADYHGYITGCVFGHSFEATTEANFAKKGMALAPLIETYNNK